MEGGSAVEPEAEPGRDVAVEVAELEAGWKVELAVGRGLSGKVLCLFLLSEERVVVCAGLVGAGRLFSSPAAIACLRAAVSWAG